MNKLQEAGQKVRERILSLADSEGRFDYGALDMIEETVREVCSEYARSKVPYSHGMPEYSAYADGFNGCIEEIECRINQDLLSLNK